MAEVFKLPVSSYEELLKLIQAYASEKEGNLLSLDDVSHSTGIPRTVVSANNGFFVQTDLISEGTKKAATEKGRTLGRAYTSKIDYEIERIWKEIIAENDFLNRMVSAVRIRNGMDRNSFLNHIVYSSGLKDNKQSRTGAGAIIEIFKNINILNEVDGKLTVNEDLTSSTDDNSIKDRVYEKTSSEITEEKAAIIPATNSVTVNININCTTEDLEFLGEKIKTLIKQISD